MHTLTTALFASLATATAMLVLPVEESTGQGASPAPMQLGNFSVSLAVKDIKASKAFYEKLDFVQVAGKIEQRWVVLQNGTTKIGLFQGMFEKNCLTFNPGWDHERKTPDEFQDVRELQRVVKERGLKPQPEADETSEGPAYFALQDPDGNPILIDQHVPKPKPKH
jgi:catechol 2,3-dioxygenase-like lactoylglutathione lyase family enzyme